MRFHAFDRRAGVAGRLGERVGRIYEYLQGDASHRIVACSSDGVYWINSIPEVDAHISLSSDVSI